MWQALVLTFLFLTPGGKVETYEAQRQGTPMRYLTEGLCKYRETWVANRQLVELGYAVVSVHIECEEVRGA